MAVQASPTSPSRAFFIAVDHFAFRALGVNAPATRFSRRRESQLAELGTWLLGLRPDVIISTVGRPLPSAVDVLGSALERMSVQGACDAIELGSLLRASADFRVSPRCRRAAELEFQKDTGVALGASSPLQRLLWLNQGFVRTSSLRQLYGSPEDGSVDAKDAAHLQNIAARLARGGKRVVCLCDWVEIDSMNKDVGDAAIPPCDALERGLSGRPLCTLERRSAMHRCAGIESTLPGGVMFA